MKKITAKVKKINDSEFFLIGVVFEKDGSSEYIVSGEDLANFKSLEEIKSFIRKNPNYDGHRGEEESIEIASQ